MWKSEKEKFKTKINKTLLKDKKYAYVWCEYHTNSEKWLTAHIQSKHRGTHYICSQCDYMAIEPGECIFQTPYSIAFKNHARLNHADVNDEKETSKVTPENNVKKTKQSMSAWKSIGNNHTTKDEVTKNQAV